jgi:carbon-monoxide dehydrogenase small subunit
MAKKPLQFHLNGLEKALFVDDGQNLLDVLRRGVGDLMASRICPA